MNRLIFFLLGIFFVFSGCQKNDIKQNLKTNNNIQSNEPSQDYEIINKRIAFKDTDSFNKHLRWIFNNQKNPELIEQFNSDLDFTSMMSIYEKGINMDDKSSFELYLKTYPNSFSAIDIDGSIFYELPAPSILAYIVNKDGIYQIGKRIYRITFKHYFEITNGDETKIPILFLPINEINDKNIKISETHNLTNRNMYSYRTVYFDDEKKTRVVARLYLEYIAGSYFYDQRTTSQKKTLGIWWQRKISEVGVGCEEGYFKFVNESGTINPHIVPAQRFVKKDAANIKVTLILVGSEIDNSKSSCLAFHWGIDGSNYKEITNNEIFP